MEDAVPALANEQTTDRWDGSQLLAALHAAAHWLEQHVETINALNVFPVPDGDTGTNMALTLSGALGGVTPDMSCATVADRVRYWATLCGRGNSGIILSQVLRGIAQGLAGHERMGARELVAALAQASVTAYQAVIRPVEGTMLTVIRDASEAARAVAVAGATLESVLEAAVRGARASVARTPTLLRALREAGVVDAGGFGLALMLEGMLRYARNEPLDVMGHTPRQPVAGTVAAIHGPDDFGYCTNFVLHGTGMPFDEIRTALGAMGQSAIVVGDAALIKVHVHTQMPGDVLNYAARFGALAQIEITNMDLQCEALRSEHGEPGVLNSHDEPGLSADSPLHVVSNPDVGIVAVAPGAGFAAIFRSFHVGAVVDGGATMNPSTADLLKAIDQVPQRDVIVLPNNRNILLAARHAAQLSSKRVEVLPSRTLPQGLAALVRFNYQAGLHDNVIAMTAALHDTCTAEITRAVRDATVDGVSVGAGQVIGLIDGTVVTAADELDPVVSMLLDQMDVSKREVLTVYYGQSVQQDAAAALAERLRKHCPQIEIELREGGQAFYDYIISAE